MTRSVLAAVTLGVAALACGASDDEAPDLGAPPTYPVPGCEHLDHRTCDVGTAACRERLMGIAACLRDSEPLDVPPVTTMTEAEFAAYLNEIVEQNPPPDPNHFETALTLFDLVEPGALAPTMQIAEDVQSVYGVYRPDEKDILLIEHGEPTDGPIANFVLVHELVHALQDADVGLDRLREEYVTDVDSYLAAAAVVEGEARFHESRAEASFLGLDPESIDWMARFQELSELAERVILDDPSPYLASYSVFPYEFGARMVHQAWRDGGQAAIDELFASPPRRSHAVMSSVTDVASADWPAAEFVPLEPPEGFELWSETSLGAWGTFLQVAQRTFSDALERAAAGWRGDHLAIYVRAEAPAETVAVWRFEFDSEELAIEVAGLQNSMTHRIFQEGPRVVLARSTLSNDTLDWALVP